MKGMRTLASLAAVVVLAVLLVASAASQRPAVVGTQPSSQVPTSVGGQPPSGVTLPPGVTREQVEQAIQDLARMTPQERADAVAKYLTQLPPDAQIPPEILKEILQLNVEELKRLVEEQGPKLQRVIDERYPPVRVDQPTAPPHLAEFLTADTWSRLKGAAKSIGRVERLDAANVQEPVGTAFFVGRDVVATNCHVAREFLSPSADGQWEIDVRRKARVVIGNETPRAFSVTELVTLPKQIGLDVAILRVGMPSAQPGPPSLPLESVGQLRPKIAIIGYAARDFADPRTTAAFKSVLDGEDVAQVLSVGFIARRDLRNGFDALVHVTSTTGGESGSPVFDLETLNVIGVHYCCRDPKLDMKSVDGPPCGRPVVPPATLNEAIAYEPKVFGVGQSVTGVSRPLP